MFEIIGNARNRPFDVRPNVSAPLQREQNFVELFETLRQHRTVENSKQNSVNETKSNCFVVLIFFSFSCEGKSSCQMLINNELFADPCASNIDKHFEIHYRCVDRSKLCSILMLNCSKAKDWKCLEKVRRENFCFCPPTICRLDEKENPIGFVESSCAEQILDEIRWKQIELNQMATVDCPKPCRGANIENQQLFSLRFVSLFFFVRFQENWKDSAKKTGNGRRSIPTIVFVRSRKRFFRHQQNIEQLAATSFVVIRGWTRKSFRSDDFVSK